MAYRFKIDSICCLNLSKACFIFGCLDLAISIAGIATFSKDVQREHLTRDVLYLTTSVIGVCTCLLMIAGSIKKNRWLMLPHIICEMLFIGAVAVIILIMTGIAVINNTLLVGLLTFAIGGVILLIYFVYWNVVYSRYLEIKKKQSAQPSCIEME